MQGNPDSGVAAGGSVARPAARAAALGALLWSGLALAQVTLQTSVSKVETTLDAGGRVERHLIPVDAVVAGEELRYTITFRNDSQTVVDAERIVITNPVPDGTRYVAGSAGGTTSRVEFSTDGESFRDAEPAATSTPVEVAGAPGGTVAQGAVRSIRWTYQQDLAPGEGGEVYFHVRMQ